MQHNASGPRGGRRPVVSQVRILRDLGLDRAQRRKFFLGEAVVYILRSGGGSGIGMVQLVQERLRSGIISISNVGGGLGDLRRYRDRSIALANAVQAREIELFGAAVVNPRLEALLLRQGFRPAIENVPDILGGGTVEILSRVYPVIR
jgi:hypothetical protein